MLETQQIVDVLLLEEQIEEGVLDEKDDIEFMDFLQKTTRAFTS